MIALLVLVLLAAERIPVPANGKFEARPGKSVRVVVEAPAEVRVNGRYAGEAEREMDITGYLRTGWNEVLVPTTAYLVFSSPVYIESAESDGKTLRVSVFNSTENTMQVEVNGEHQYTVSPGTAREIGVPASPLTKTVTIRAISDGLDLSYEDKAEVIIRAKSPPRDSARERN